MKKHTLKWFKNRIGKTVQRHKDRHSLVMDFVITEVNCIPFYTSQKDFNYRFKEL